MANPTVKIIRSPLPRDGELSSTSGSHSARVATAIGNTTAALTRTESAVTGRELVTIIYIFGA